MASPTSPAATTSPDPVAPTPVAPAAPPPQKSPEEQRADDLFGEGPDTPSSDPDLAVAREFGAEKVWRGRGKGRNDFLKAKPSKAFDAPKSTPPEGAPEGAGPEAAAPEAAPDSVEGAEGGEEAWSPEDLAPSPIEYKGKTLQIPAVFAKYVKNLQGQFKSFDRRTREATTIAHQWMAHAKAIEARTQQQQSPASQSAPAAKGQAPPPSSPGGESPASLSDAIDWKSFDDVYRQSPTTAVQWLADLSDRVLEARMADVEARLAARFDEGLAPVKVAKEMQEKIAKVGKFFGDMANQTYDDGSEVYPDTNDEGFVVELHKVWDSYPESPWKHSPHAFHSAYLTMVDWFQRQGKPLPSKAAASRRTPSTPPSPAEALLREAADGRDAAVLGGGAAATVPRPGSAPPAAPANRGDALLRQMDKAGKKDDVFGVRY